VATLGALDESVHESPDLVRVGGAVRVQRDHDVARDDRKSTGEGDAPARRFCCTIVTSDARRD
jgi:hypothetical protein